MKILRNILALASMLYCAVVYGQGFTMPETTVSWTVKSEHVEDSLYRIVFTGKVADGWHTYGLESDLYPTAVEFGELQGYTPSAWVSDLPVDGRFSAGA